jgi:hypothetical protein
MGHQLGFDLGIGDHHKFPWLQAKAGWSQNEGCFQGFPEVGGYEGRCVEFLGGVAPIQGTEELLRG